MRSLPAAVAASLTTLAAPSLGQTSPPSRSGQAIELAPIVIERPSESLKQRLLPPGAASVTTIGRDAIEASPGGTQTSFDKLILQLPGVSQDSAASGDFHVRNEHANVQYRVNGILLPDGVSGFSQVLDTSFVRTLTLLDGALPAQYGLHTAGIADIETRSGLDQPGGSISLYGGSHATFQTTIEEAGGAEGWDYFVTGRFARNGLGIENPLPTEEAVHDDTRQGRYFAYLSRPLEDGSRLTFMSGAASFAYQIPNTPGLAPAFTAYGTSTFNSALLNENQVERSLFTIAAWQKSTATFDTQLSYFQRYSNLHFLPDPIGDILFNGVASDVVRTSLVNGLQEDTAWRLSSHDTLRFGFIGDIERAEALDNNVVLPVTAAGVARDAPFAISDLAIKTGFVGGLYASNEIHFTPELAVTTGVRFDGVSQYVSTDQLSPRFGLVYTPTSDTTIHAGYARTFTPSELALSAPTPFPLYAGTTLAASTSASDLVRPERAHLFDLGVTHQLWPALEIGADAYYKLAKNLLDDGQFGQALVLTAFNYDHAYNDGIEFKAAYNKGDLRAYINVAIAQQRAEQISSNQYLFDTQVIAYIQNHYIFTDHDQLVTASGGISDRIANVLFSADVVFGSGLRDGFANTATVAPHAIVNLGAAYDVQLVPNGKPTTLRLTLVNALDTPYAIRDGSGIGVFAPQYGERRGFYAGVTQRF